MNRLSGHAQADGDLLPRPVLVAGVVDLQRFQALDEYPQRSHCSKPDGGVLATRIGGQLRRITHNCHLRLTESGLSTTVDHPASAGDRPPIPCGTTAVLSVLSRALTASRFSDQAAVVAYRDFTNFLL